MGQVTKAKEYLSVSEIDKRIKTSKEAWRIRRWMIIRHALVDPQPAAEISLRLGVAKQTVHNLISLYNRKGASAVETPGKGRRQRAYLSLSEERHFLEEFNEQSAKGQVPTVLKIHEALEEQLQQPVAKSTVYRLLKRHRWRKVAPRPRHPQADPAQVEAILSERKAKELANKAFDSLSTLMDALCHGLNQLAEDPQRLRSLTNFPYLKITFDKGET